MDPRNDNEATILSLLGIQASTAALLLLLWCLWSCGFWISSRERTHE
jgi:hypothetical protein